MLILDNARSLARVGEICDILFFLSLITVKPIVRHNLQQPYTSYPLLNLTYSPTPKSSRWSPR